MSTNFSRRNLGAALALAGLLVACGGGGGVGDLAEGGIGGTGMTIGPISAFGSIYVNGVEYDTDRAEVLINGESVGAEALRLGMWVTVSGDLDADGGRGVAARIVFDPLLRGPLAGVDSVNGELRVAGQRAWVDELTVFAGVDSLEQLNPGDVVRVSGQADAEGNILASRVEKLTPPDKDRVKIRGRVAELDVAGQRFRLNELWVDFSAAGLLEIMPANGLFLEVEGRLDQGLLRAERLASAPAPVPGTGDRLGLQGVITEFVSPEQFKLARRAAKITPATRFEFGGPADLAPGVNLRGAGRVDQAGLLVLDRVSFMGEATGRSAPGRILLSAPLQTWQPAQNTLRLADVSARLLPGAIFHDPENPEGRAFNPRHLGPGRRLTLRGFIAADSGVFLVERVESGGPPDQMIHVQAPAQKIAPMNFGLELLGLRVMAKTDTRYFNALRQPPPLAEPGGPPRPPPQTATDAADFFQAASRAGPEALVHAGGPLIGEGLLQADTLVLLPARLPRASP